MSGYTKLFSDIITSSVWNEDDKTRIVWITLLALSDATGYVHCALPSLALMARMDQAACEASLKKLSAPDEYSRTPDNHGIRISKVDGGWMILNYEKHRNRLSNDHEAASGRERVRKYRERRKNVTCNVTGCNSASASASDSASDLNSSLKGLVIPESLNIHEFMEAWENWIQHRKEIKKPLRRKSAEMQIKCFVEWGASKSINAIEFTILKGWQGIRQPDNKQEKQNDTDKRRSEKASREFPEHIEIPTL